MDADGPTATGTSRPSVWWEPPRLAAAGLGLTAGGFGAILLAYGTDVPSGLGAILVWTGLLGSCIGCTLLVAGVLTWVFVLGRTFAVLAGVGVYLALGVVLTPSLQEARGLSGLDAGTLLWLAAIWPLQVAGAMTGVQVGPN